MVETTPLLKGGFLRAVPRPDSIATLFLPFLSFLLNAGAADSTFIQIHAQGWTQMGRLMHVTDTLGGTGTPVNLNGNWQQSSGAQFTAVASIGDGLEGALGFGGYQIYHSQGTSTQQRLMRTLFQNFITEARMTWFQGEKSHPDLSLTFGKFSYNYNPDVKNMGLYLLRGPVYPGYLMSGFKDFSTDTTKGNILGGRIHQALGNFQQDLIFSNERDLPPTFDWSLAYVAKFRAFDAIEVGGGVNFYRLIPNDSKLEDVRNPEPTGDTAHPIDTVTYSNQGVKLMAMFNVDFKKWLPVPGMGRNDFKLYGEAAVLGVKNYGSYYDNVLRRIPVMVGFNIPTFGWLDLFSLEVEWYGSRYRNSLYKIGNYNTLYQPPSNLVPLTPVLTVPQPLPLSYKEYYGQDLNSNGQLLINNGVGFDTLQVKGTAWDVENLTTDNWKWSLYLEKTVHRHIGFIAQVANDHFRPRPVVVTPSNEKGGMAEAFTAPGDWYWMLRVGYYF